MAELIAAAELLSLDFSVVTESMSLLCVSSGAKIGHRSLMRYYKQRFGAQRVVVLTHNKNAVGRVLRQYKSLGWGGDTGKSQ